MNAPTPFLFNPLKHHLGYIQKYINETNPSPLREDLMKIGGSLMDLYTGRLAIEEICQQIKLQLVAEDAFDRASFQKSLKRCYQKLTLGDDSEWILRTGNDPDRYIHIHPGRYSPHSIRIKASTLKTVIGCLLIYGKSDIDLLKINQVRTEVLGLSAIARIYSFKKIEHLLD